MEIKLACWNSAKRINENVSLMTFNFIPFSTPDLSVISLNLSEHISAFKNDQVK